MIHEAPSEYPAVEGLLKLVADSEPAPVPLRGFTTDKANGQLILLARTSLAPKRPDGSVIDVAAEFERSGSRSVTELVPGHRTNAAARGFWPLGSPPPTGQRIQRSWQVTPSVRPQQPCYAAGTTTGSFERVKRLSLLWCMASSAAELRPACLCAHPWRSSLFRIPSLTDTMPTELAILVQIQAPDGDSVAVPPELEAEDAAPEGDPLLKFSLAGAQLKFSVYESGQGPPATHPTTLGPTTTSPGNT
jgi:hypothetical protein